MRLVNVPTNALLCTRTPTYRRLNANVALITPQKDFSHTRPGSASLD